MRSDEEIAASNVGDPSASFDEGTWVTDPDPAERHRSARADERRYRDVYNQGIEDAKGGAPPKANRPSSGGLKIGSGAATRNGAGLVLGVLAYTLGLNFIRGGLPAVTGWLGAKFINKPYSGTLAPITTAPGGGRPARAANAGAGSGL